MGHRCFLLLDHKWCNQKSQFNGKKERKKAPKLLFGDYVLKKILPLELIIFEKYGKKRGLEGHRKFHYWKKHNIFFYCHIGEHLFGDDVLKQILPLELIIFEKYGKKRGLEGHRKFHNWKKHNIFFSIAILENTFVTSQSGCDAC